MPKSKKKIVGDGVKIEKAKETLKKWSIPIVGLTATTMVAMAKILSKNPIVEKSVEEGKDILEALGEIGIRGSGLKETLLRDFPQLIGETADLVIQKLKNNGGGKVGKGKLRNIVNSVVKLWNKARKPLYAFILKTAKTGAKAAHTLIKAYGYKNALKLVNEMIKDTKYKEFVPILKKLLEFIETAEEIKKEATTKTKTKEKSKLKGRIEKATKKATEKKAKVQAKIKDRPTRRGTSPWVNHVKKYAADNDVSYRVALQKASATYKKPN